MTDTLQPRLTIMTSRSFHAFWFGTSHFYRSIMLSQGPAHRRTLLQDSQRPLNQTGRLRLPQLRTIHLTILRRRLASTLSQMLASSRQSRIQEWLVLPSCHPPLRTILPPPPQQGPRSMYPTSRRSRRTKHRRGQVLTVLRPSSSNMRWNQSPQSSVCLA